MLQIAALVTALEVERPRDVEAKASGLGLSPKNKRWFNWSTQIYLRNDVARGKVGVNEWPLFALIFLCLIFNLHFMARRSNFGDTLWATGSDLAGFFFISCCGHDACAELAGS